MAWHSTWQQLQRAESGIISFTRPTQICSHGVPKSFPPARRIHDFRSSARLTPIRSGVITKIFLQAKAQAPSPLSSLRVNAHHLVVNSFCHLNCVSDPGGDTRRIAPVILF